MKNLIFVTVFVFAVCLLGCVDLKNTDANQIIKKTTALSDTLGGPTVPNYILKMLPDGATNIVVIDEYEEFDDCWMTFELQGKPFLFGAVYGTSSRFSTCITEITY
jgi:hypothetical protein